MLKRIMTLLSLMVSEIVTHLLKPRIIWGRSPWVPSTFLTQDTTEQATVIPVWKYVDEPDEVRPAPVKLPPARPKVQVQLPRPTVNLREQIERFIDGHSRTKVRIKAVKPVIQPIAVIPSTPPLPRISRARASMGHQCIPPSDILPWTGGSWYCPLCRTTRTYVPLQLPRHEATEPHFVPRIRGRHNGHLRYTSQGLVDTGKLCMPGRRA